MVPKRTWCLKEAEYSAIQTGYHQFANEKGLNEQAKKATFTLIVVQKRHHTRFWAEKRINSQLDRDAMFVFLNFFPCFILFVLC